MLHGDNFAVVIPVDYKEHDEHHQFCLSPTCPCREDQASLQTLNQQVQEGLLSVEEAQRIYEGKMLISTRCRSDL